MHPFLPTVGDVYRYEMRVNAQRAGGAELRLDEISGTTDDAETTWHWRSSGDVFTLTRACSLSEGMQDPWAAGPGEDRSRLWRWPAQPRMGAVMHGELRTAIRSSDVGTMLTTRRVSFAGLERITTPAGTFQAWRVTGVERATLGTLPTVVNSVTMWLVEGVGLLRMVREGAGTTVEQVLTAVESGGQ